MLKDILTYKHTSCILAMTPIYSLIKILRLYSTVETIAKNAA